jgi:hypothetical protein
MIDYKALMPVLIKHKITPSQFLLMLLIQQKQFKLIYQYENPMNEGGRWVTVAEIENLVERGYLRWMNPNAKERTYFPSEFEVTDKFLSEIYHENPMTAAEEFWDCYPAKIGHKGQTIAAHSLGKVMDKQRFLEWYAEHFGGEVNKHAMVMEGLRHAKKAGTLALNIFDYLNSGAYESDYMASRESDKELTKSMMKGK